jgi:hypothetical protein
LQYVPLLTGEDGVVRTTPANLVANRIYVKKDTPYSFLDRPFMAQVFDDPHRRILLKTARQVSKSTTIAARMLTHCEVDAPYSCLYMSPSEKQTSTFSHDRLGPTIKDSPHIANMTDADSLQNVFAKSFSNGSKIGLVYAKDNADRARGNSADELDLDEVQDMNLDAIEPVAGEVLFMSKLKRRMWSGTPKSLSNGIEKRLWRKSDQREWMVRCRHHTPTYHQKLTRANVGKEGPICNKCGKELDTLDGLWVITSTRTEEGKTPHIHGYHIPQIIFPTMKRVLGVDKKGKKITGPLDWADFLLECENNDDVFVQNEKFGESADSSDKPISEDQIRALCDSTREMPTEYKDWMIGAHTFAGIDWGTGKASTALTIGQFDPKDARIFRIIFCRRFWKREADPKTCLPEIKRLLGVFRCKRGHADWGSGLGMNSHIEEAKGDDFLTKNFWSDAIAGKKVSYNKEIDSFVLNRSVAFSRFFEALKRQAIKVAFSWDYFKTYADDVLNVFREERANGNPFYDHEDGTMDDFAHSIIYCWTIASWMRYSEGFVDHARRAGRAHDPSRIM